MGTPERGLERQTIADIPKKGVWHSLQRLDFLGETGKGDRHSEDHNVCWKPRYSERLIRFLLACCLLATAYYRHNQKESQRIQR